LPGEFEERMAAAGLHVTQFRDHSEDIVRLIDRVEGRLTVARTRSTASSLGGSSANVPMPSREMVAAIATSLREAVADGRLGYFAAVATRAA